MEVSLFNNNLFMSGFILLYYSDNVQSNVMTGNISLCGLF